MGLVTLQSVTIGAALLLICCGDPEAKARRLLNQAQALEREGKEQEAQPLLDDLLKGYPQTSNTGSQAPEPKEGAQKSTLFCSSCKRNLGTRPEGIIGTAQLIYRSTNGKFGIFGRAVVGQYETEPLPTMCLASMRFNVANPLEGENMNVLTIAVLGLSLTTVLATAPNLCPAAVKEPKDTKPKVQTERDTSQEQRRLEREVRHELVTLPYYDVFDNLEYRVDGSQVTLSGQVVRPTLKSGAENVVKNIEGVEKVTNNIEVLPLSPNDDGIRVAVYRAIYGHTALQRYSVRSVPPIHIIVRNGNVTLEGVVANEGDKNIANIQANGVSGVFSVTNNLRLDK